MQKAKWNTTGLDKMLARLEALQSREIRWGFFQESRYPKANESLPVAEVARRQEEGIPELRVPARPFFTSQLLRIKEIGDPVGAKVYIRVKGLVTDYMLGFRSKSFKPLQQALQQSLQQEILDWSSPSNAKSTIERKGFDDPLIHTGRMYDSVKAKLVTRGTEDA